jgi:hypothetical protein
MVFFEFLQPIGAGAVIVKHTYITTISLGNALQKSGRQRSLPIVVLNGAALADALYTLWPSEDDPPPDRLQQSPL